MDYLYERLAYLKGLAEGLSIEESSKEGKLLVQIIDILEDFADAIDEVQENQEEIEDYVGTMDEDLSDVEDDLYGDEEDEFEFDEEDMGCNCDCDCE